MRWYMENWEVRACERMGGEEGVREGYKKNR